MFSTLTWGIVLIILGTTLLINTIFGLNLPIFKILLASFFIYLGIRILTKSSTSFTSKRFCSSSTFSAAQHTEDQDKYDITFDSCTIDLTDLDTLVHKKTVVIKPAFSTISVFLPKNVPAIVKTDVSFSTVSLPDGRSTSFGSAEYQNLHGEREPLLKVIIKGSFSTIIVRD